MTAREITARLVSGVSIEIDASHCVLVSGSAVFASMVWSGSAAQSGVALPPSLEWLCRPVWSGSAAQLFSGSAAQSGVALPPSLEWLCRPDGLERPVWSGSAAQLFSGRPLL